MAENESIPVWWVALFLLLALGLAVASVYAVGGSLTDASVLFPLSI